MLSLFQEPWLCDPNAAVPSERSCIPFHMSPDVVKKELESHASLIQLFGSDSSIVKERPAPHGGWAARVPTAILSELHKLTGWQRCEESKGFIVEMPSPYDALVLSDECFVPYLAHRSIQVYMLAVIWNLWLGYFANFDSFFFWNAASSWQPFASPMTGLC